MQAKQENKKHKQNKMIRNTRKTKGQEVQVKQKEKQHKKSKRIRNVSKIDLKIQRLSQCPTRSSHNSKQASKAEG